MSQSPQQGLMPLAFEESLVRVIPDPHGAPLFVAKDVALALDYEWKGSSTIGHVPEEWRGVYSVQTPSAIQEMLTLTEQGLYFFLGRSDKPKALPFQKWLAGEVLPALRKTGSYGQAAQPVMTPGNVTLAELRRLVALWAMLTNMPSQSLCDQLFTMFGLQEENSDQQAINAAALHVLHQNNQLLAQGRKVSEQAVARYQREIQIVTEPPMLKLFWQQFHTLNADGRLNHSRNPDLIALRLTEVVQAAKAQDICPFTVTELRRLLPLGHTYRLMAASKVVYSVLLGRTVRCMVFFRPQTEGEVGHE
ncbi:MAG: BRO family protein [Desulfovibrio desulfuricans]|nr:BRO family protein [Desulfovibrio desulfuricans]